MSGNSNFWARRRESVAAEERADQAAAETRALAQEHAALEEKSDDEILAELNLPDPDALKMGDDFKVFMSQAVPDRIRRRALRTLWRSNPVLANVDALVDYGEDFTDSAMAVENIQTAYQVGKGMLKHVEEMARQAEARENPPVEEEPLVEEAEKDELLAEVAVDTAAEPTFVEEADEEEAMAAFVPVTPRRMKFRPQGGAA